MTWVTLGGWSDTGPEAAGVILADRLGRVCLQLRDDFAHVKGAGQWGFFGGERDAGESLTDTAIREMAEETGLQFRAADLTPLARIRSDRGTRIHMFATPRRFTPADIRVREGAGFGFLTRAQIAAGPTLASTRAVAEHWLDTGARAR